MQKNKFIIFLIILLLLSCKKKVITEYQDGTIHESYMVENGEKNGFYTEYYPSGNKKISAIYLNNLLDGQYTEYYDSIINYGEVKQLFPKKTCYYRRGFLHGLCVNYYNNGYSDSINYYLGKKYGKEVIYDQNNNLLKMAEYILRDKTDTNKFVLPLDSTKISQMESYLNATTNITYPFNSKEYSPILSYAISSTKNNTISLKDTMHVSCELFIPYFGYDNSHKVVSMQFKNSTNDKINLKMFFNEIPYMHIGQCAFCPSKKGDGILWGLIKERNTLNNIEHLTYIKFKYFVK